MPVTLRLQGFETYAHELHGRSSTYLAFFLIDITIHLYFDNSFSIFLVHTLPNQLSFDGIENIFLSLLQCLLSHFTQSISHTLYAMFTLIVSNTILANAISTTANLRFVGLFSFENRYSNRIQLTC